MVNYPINKYPVGSVVICRFAFTTRALTQVELATFLAGNGLPANVGSTPAQLYFDYEAPDTNPPIVTQAGIVTDAPGAFHYNLTLTIAGSWHYRGRGVDAQGNPVAATPDQVILATRDF